jgi:SAM-dependent methyltransferase
MLPKGWTKHESKTHNRTYYLHSESGRRQWEVPSFHEDKDIELIKEYFEEEHRGSEFSNFLKNCFFEETSCDLLSDYLENFKFTVLDLGCSNGTDLGKWQRLGASSYTGIDFSEKKIAELANRQADSIAIISICADFTSQNTWDTVLKSKRYDVISLQYCLEYCFHSISSAVNIFNGISKCLSGRGRVYITVSENKGKASYGKKIEGPCPSWGVFREQIETHCSENGLEIGLDVNLANFACFLGICAARSGPVRKINFNSQHYPNFLRCCPDELVESECWKKASTERAFLLRRIGSNVARGVQKEFDTWTVARESGMLDALG